MHIVGSMRAVVSFHAIRLCSGKTRLRPLSPRPGVGVRRAGITESLQGGGT